MTRTNGRIFIKFSCISKEIRGNVICTYPWSFLVNFYHRSSLNNTNFSMTTLLTHTVAYSTKPSFMPKTNNSPLKNFKSCAQLSKSCQKWQNSDFQSQFSMSKNIRIFLKKNFIEEYQFRRTFFVKSIFCWLQFLTPNFWQTVTGWRHKIW